MPISPTPNTTLGSLRPDLGGALEEFDLVADRGGFIGLMAAPVFEVPLRSGDYPVIPLDELLKNKATARASGGGYSRSSFQFGKNTYATDENGHEVPVGARLRAIYAEMFDAEMIAAKLARDVVLRNLENRLASLLFNATTWTGSALTTAPTNEWDDATNAVPITDVDAARDAVWDATGVWPDTLIINRKVYNNLRKNTQIIARIESNGAGTSSAKGLVNIENLRQVFELDKILVAGGAKNTANEGQTAAVAQVWSGEYAMVCKTADRGQDISEPCVARTFHWGGDGSDIGAAIDSYDEPRSRSTVVRARHDTDEVVIKPQFGHLISNITT